MTSGDWADVLAEAGEEAGGRHAMTGVGRSIVANRVSHVLGLAGPSFVVDTGQSSGLAAVHLACESLLGGEATVAIAGGVNLILSPLSSLRAAESGALSPDGRARVFDAGANGFVRGEGGAVLVLKPLDAAVADGDRVYAVIDGTATGTGSGAQGMTAPSAATQERVLRAALDRAGVDPRDVGYVELHGTGTPAGDPVEAAALGAVFGAERDRPLAVGSVKARIGHLEGAAGAAGLLVAALCLHRRELVRSLHFAAPPPDIPLGELGLRVLTASEPWPQDATAAGVSSFGVGGTTCHAVLSAAHMHPALRSLGSASAPASVAVPWVLSGSTLAGLAGQARELAAHLDGGDTDPLDIGLTLAAHRAHLRQRAVVVGATTRERRSGLEALAQARPAVNVVSGAASEARTAAFVFPGQGAQWPGMGLALLTASPVFRAALDACDAALRPFLGVSVLGILRDRGTARLDRVDLVQPVLFAVHVALAAQWRRLGVEPSVVVGHSQGEIAAAHVAGALSLDDAARVVALRARALADIAGAGGMLAASLSLQEAQERATAYGDRIAIAAVNGPASVVLSGEPDALDELERRCEADGVRARRVAVDYASHSPQVEAIRERLLADLASITPREATVPLLSTTTAAMVRGPELGAAHWYENLRRPVRFEETVRALLDDGVGAFIECSAHPVLTWAVEETVRGADADAIAVGTLRRDEGGPDRLLLSAGEAWVRGVEVDWARAFAGTDARRTDLPTYAFHRARHWVSHPDEEAEALRDDAGPAGRGAELAGLGVSERTAELIAEVRAQAAAVLGHASGEEVAADRAFKDLGFDSLAAVELSRRLATLTGLDLPSTLAFDHPTPAAVAAHLASRLDEAAGERAAAPAPTSAEPSRPARRRRPRGRADEPIAIVGMACRYPGGVASARDLWRLVATGADAVGDFPADRGWDVEAIFDPDPDHPGTTYTRRGGFLDDAAGFDAGFFGIGPREALAMDPQQRLLLETAWEAVEDAGLDPTSLAGSPTAVYAGVSTADYGSFQPQDAPELEGLRLTGALTSVMSGRVAYALGLEGPAVTVDTACSSSLVALHLACRALRAGDCTLALAGGATVLATPGMFVEFARQRGLAADGRCKSFAAAADGTGWAEGAGLLLLERLSDARRHGRRVLAVVRGTAVNQDGASNGLTAPNGPSQEHVIREALADAGLAPRDVDAVEAHGTGTTLGDPIEARALLATYGRDRPDGPLRLGSVKSNIGHAQAAAGVAGVMKMVMALREEILPPTLHVDAPTPHVDWSSGGVALLTEPVPWPAGMRRRRAGVSSFGISGTNAHVILEEAPAAPAEGEAPRATPPPPAVAWIVSARSEAALRAQAERLRAHVAADPDAGPADVALGLSTGRARLPHRGVVAGRDREALLSGLGALAAGAPAARVAAGAVRDATGRAAFVFPGQGSQWAGMGAALAADSPVFAAALRACEDALAPYTDVGLADALGDAAALQRVDVVQPALFAVHVALAALWRSLGVEPSVVIGHSQGEIAAAHVAGVLGLDDAARVVALRSRALAELAGAGGMLSVSLPPDEVEDRLARWPGRLSVAALNGPRSVVVSGDPEALDDLAAVCERDGVRSGRIPVDYASHSPQVDRIRERLLTDLAPIVPRPAVIPLVSTTTAAAVEGPELDAAHWFRNLRERVLFEPVVRALAAEGTTAFIECSAHPVLTWAIEETAGDATVTGTLRRDDGALDRVLESAGAAWVSGVDVAWERPLEGTSARRADLPTYAFQHTRYWQPPRAGADRRRDAAAHPLLDDAVALAGRDALLLTGRVGLRTHPWLADHAVSGTTLLPGTAVVELALHAAREAGGEVVDELTLEAPLALGDDEVELQLSVGEPAPDGRRDLELHARPADRDAAWTRHASGLVGPARGAGAEWSQGAWPPPGAEPLDVAALEDRLETIGYAYGPAFRAVRAAWTHGDQILAEVALGPDAAGDAGRFAAHPALLDAALHPWFGRPGEEGVQLPFRWAGVRVVRPGATSLRVRLAPAGEDAVSVVAAGDDGEPVLTVDALTARAPALGALGARPGPDALLEIRWSEAVARPAAHDDDLVEAGDARAALALVQERLAADDSGGRLVVVTRSAVAARPGDVPDPRAAEVWGLVRSAQTEHPGRFALLDVDAASAAGPLPAVPPDEPQAALRDGALLVPRLGRAAGAERLADDRRLGVRRPGSLDGVDPVASDGGRPLGAGEVRIAVRVAGVNFRDVLLALGTYPGEAPLGSEAAGVVVETGPEVSGLAAGDRVTGLVPESFGPLAVADARLLVPVPAGWSFAEAATLPVAFATAHHGLVDLAGLRPGERVLVHAAAGGVGLAAVHLARRAGAEVFATASPAKWDVLRALGIDDDHLASSRTSEFRERFLETTGGEGVDVVLDALAGELVDASLDLLPRGGRFIEMGKADVRDAAEVAAAHPGVEYRAFDLFDAGPDHLGAILREISGAVAAGELAALPLTAWDVEDGVAALRHVAQGRHVGKVLLTVTRGLDPEGTVLVTGGTGALGRLVARHLAEVHGARHVVLAGRRGPEAEGAAELAAELAALGCEASLVACDVGDRDALAALLDAIPAVHPLTAVVHAAGALADGVVESLDGDALAQVMRPKAEAARHLDELTAGADLAAFVLFSSVAGTLGTPGQANYAAANAALDALAARRRAAGRPATSIAWGLWAEASGLTGAMRAEDVARLAREGIRPLPTDEGLALLDAALAHTAPVLVALPLDRPALRERAAAGTLPALLRDLARLPGAPATAGAVPIARRLAGAAPEDRRGLLVDLVREQAAATLGLDDVEEVRPERSFKDLGFDSLAAVELRNRLGQVTGLRLPSTLVFDHPTPADVAALLEEGASAPAPAQAPVVEAPVEPSPGPGEDAGTMTEGESAFLARRTQAAPDPSMPLPPVPLELVRADGAPPPRSRTSPLGAATAAVRLARFRAWVLAARLRLARQGCRLVVEAAEAPRLDAPLRLVIDAAGAGGTFTLRIGRECRFGRDVTLDVRTDVDGLVEIGDRGIFQDRIRLQAWGGAIRLGAQTQVRDGSELKSRGELTTGSEVVVARNVTIHCHERIELGDHVGLAEGVTVMDSDHTHDGSDVGFLRQPVVSTPVLLEDNVMVATNAVVLRGVHVGRNAFVATGAVLTAGEYPARHLLAGVPAVPIRPLGE